MDEAGSEYFYVWPTDWYTVEHLYRGLRDHSIVALRNPPSGGIIIDGNNVVPRKLGSVVFAMRHFDTYFIDKVNSPVSREALSDCLRELSTVRMGGMPVTSGLRSIQPRLVSMNSVLLERRIAEI